MKKARIVPLQGNVLEWYLKDNGIFRRNLNFAKTVKGLCNINPFEQCITIASLCNLIFHTMFLKKETIAIITHVGYKKKAKQSAVACRWLSYVAQQRGVYIQHGHNVGERRVGPCFLDDCCDDTRTDYQFHECFYHG